MTFPSIPSAGRRVSPRLRALPAFVLLAFAALVLALHAPSAHAQASQTAGRTADISVFAGFEVADPAYGPDKNGGVALGLDFTRYLVHSPIQPSLEVRLNFNSGTFASEHSYLFGLRGHHDFGRLRPYGDFLLGPGNIHYPLNVGYVGDNSTVYNYGGGVDIAATRNFSLKLDLQGQHWNTGDIRFSPTIGTVGITYTIPFGPHVSQRYLRR